MRLTASMIVLGGLVIGAGCFGRSLARSDVIQIQQAAIEFFAGQHGKSDAPQICVRIASGPDEMAEGMVAKGLEDPPGSVIERLQAKGLRVRPYSACATGEPTVELAIGWPTRAGDGAQVPADRLCGAMCGGGFTVDVRRVETGWRAVGAHATWVS